tara:strand:- start:531 stop:998 length:468 start_codon:yes stop_codon:yes gene_type:complete
MYRLVIICLFVFGLSNLFSQNYMTGIGVRGGLANGFSIKHFIEENKAIEGIFISRWDGFQITGLYEYSRVFYEDNISYFYGLGGSIGFFDGTNVPWSASTHQYTLIGIDGIAGIEYCFDNIPFSISFDYKPTFTFIGYQRVFLDNGALTLRYIMQ